MATTTLLCGAISHSTNKTQMRFKKRDLRAIGDKVVEGLAAKGMKASYIDNTDCDGPHIVVCVEPTSQRPDGQFWPMNLREMPICEVSVVRFLSGAA